MPDHTDSRPTDLHGRPYEFVRYLIRAGDTTQAGGIVQPGAVRNFTMDGAPATFEGDPVDCPACGSVGATACVPPRLSNTGPDGRQRSLDGDLCICRCDPPPRLIANRRNHFMAFNRAQIANQHGVDRWLVATGHSPALTSFDQHFVVFDKANQRPCDGFTYGLSTGGSSISGTLDPHGATGRVYSNNPEEVTLEYLVQTTIGVRK